VPSRRVPQTTITFITRNKHLVGGNFNCLQHPFFSTTMVAQPSFQLVVMFKLVATFYEGGDMAISFVKLRDVSQDKPMDMDLTIVSPL